MLLQAVLLERPPALQLHLALGPAANLRLRVQALAMPH